MQTTAAEMTEVEVEVKADTETKNKVKKKGRKKKDGKRKQTRTNVEEETLSDGDDVLEKSAKKCGSDSSNKKKKKNKEKKEKKTKPKKSMDHLFSVDLVEQTKRHIIFLRTLHKQGITTDDKEELLEESFRRYSQLWLPFVAHHHHRNHHCASLDDTNKTNQTPTNATDIALIPPPDIAWFWHCHRLAPYRYAKYVRRVLFTKDHHDDDHDDVFKVLDPSHPFVVQLEKNNQDCNNTWRQLVSSLLLSSSSSTVSSALTNPDNEDYAKISQCTRDLFAEMYPNESFFLESSSSSATTTPATGHLLAGFNLIESCRRQATFLWQVSGPNFLLENNDINDTFLREGMTNYARFVKLTNHPQRREMSSSMSSLISPLVPTYQIDLIWHTHILSSIKNYHKDVMKLTAACATTSGSSRSRKTIVLNHDDSIDNDRSEGSVLDTSFKQTRNLWKDVYGLEYVVMGGMYRGEPPPEYYHMDWTPSSQLPSIYASRSVKMTKYTANNDAFVSPSSPDVDPEGYVYRVGDWMPFNHDEGFVSPSSHDVDRGGAWDRTLKRDNPYLEGYVYGLGGTCLCLCSILFYMFCFDSLLYTFSCKSYIVCMYVPYLLS